MKNSRLIPVLGVTVAAFALVATPLQATSVNSQHKVTVQVQPTISIASLNGDNLTLKITGFTQGDTGFVTGAYRIRSNNTSTAAISDAVTVKLDQTLPKVRLTAEGVNYVNAGNATYAILEQVSATPIVLDTTAKIVAQKPSSAGLTNGNLLAGDLFFGYIGTITTQTAGPADGGIVNVTVTFKDA